MKKEIIKRFEFSGKATFCAKNINDAFKKLGKHFEELSKDKDDNLFEPDTDIRIKPIEK